MPNGKCRVHGGKTPGSVASPHYKTGRYSKFIPARLSERYQEALQDTELLAVREDVALLDSRLADVLAAVSNQEAGELWKQVKEALRDYDKGKNEGEKAEAFGHLRWLINEGYQEWQSWMEIRHILQERKALVESEQKRLVNMQQMISVERANLLISAISDIIRQNVSDRNTLAAISAGIGNLITV